MKRVKWLVFATSLSLLAATGLRAQGSARPSGPGREGGGAFFGDSLFRGLNTDPIGFLLEIRDSLKLADSVRTELVRLNLRLYRRNRQVQLRLDSIMPEVPEDTRYGVPTLSPELRQRMAPLIAQLRSQSEAARDTAYGMLTDQQKEIAERLRDRPRQRGQGRP